MTHSELVVTAIGLALLILISAFFSCAETGLMVVNRYRLRHKARMKKAYAKLILKLLKRPDRMLGTILIGNNFANILASSLATLLAIHLLGESWVIPITIVLTFFILIFAEVAPKTFAAVFPDRVVKWVVYPIFVLQGFLYPIVWVINVIANSILRLLGIKIVGSGVEPLTREELRTIVYETAGRISRQYQSMLLGILDLNKMTVDDAMVPRHEITGIDIAQPWEDVQKQLASSHYDWLPVYRDNINQIIGVLHLRDVISNRVFEKTFNDEYLMSLIREPYFVPEATPLNVQLMHFKRNRQRIAFIVDEYGEIKGLITVHDILEEIVGEFTTSIATATQHIQLQTDGSYLVDAAIGVRELNRFAHLNLPIKGPRTLNGLLVEYLEAIPHAGSCVKIANYPIEIMVVKGNRVKMARIFPRLLDE